jgi:dipeptidyl aminopeptidase/acylaminoacyl peptidase
MRIHTYPRGSHTRLSLPRSYCNKRTPATLAAAVIRSVALIATLISSCYSPAVFSQTAKPLSVEDAIKTRRFSEYSPLAVSPDNNFIAYAVRPSVGLVITSESYSRTGVTIGGGKADIELLDVVTGQEQNLTGGRGSNWQPVWSPDGNWLAFLSDRDGSGQARLWLWDRRKQILHRASELNVRGQEISWMPDSQRILFTILPVGLSLDEYVERFSGAPKMNDPAPVVSPGSTVRLYEVEHSSTGAVIESQSAPWALDWALRDLAMVNISTGQINMLVTGERLAKYALSRDGAHMAYTQVKRFEAAGSQQTLFDIVWLDTSTLKSQVIAADVPMGISGEDIEWSPNDSRLVYRNSSSAGPSFTVLDVSGPGSPQILKLAFPQSVANGLSRIPLWNTASDHLFFVKDGAVWTAGMDQSEQQLVARVPGLSFTSIVVAAGLTNVWTAEDGRTILVTAKDDTSNQDAFYSIDLKSARSKKLRKTGECFTCAAVDQKITAISGDKRFFYFAESVDRDSDIWVSNMTFETPRRLTRLNAQFDRYRMGQARVIDWLSDDGEALHGALLLPAEYQEGKRYPLLVWVYAGSLPTSKISHFGFGLYGPLNLQLFATRGYAVLLPDSPQEQGRPMLDLVKTVLPGVSKVVEMGIADPKRLGVMGHSNGGYSVLGLVAQTKRFAAAVEMDGFPDMVGEYTEMNKSGSAFGTSLFEHVQDGLGGTLWQFPKRYVENSPIFYFDQVDTPLLIVQGGADATVIPSMGDETFVSLRRLGKNAEYAKYDGEGHSPLYWSYANQVDLSIRTINWLEKYLKKEFSLATHQTESISAARATNFARRGKFPITIPQ